MANENNERMSANQEEVNTPISSGSVETAGSTVGSRQVSSTSGRTTTDTEFADTEFAADTWMGAVFSPDATRTGGNIAYNPRTQTERYVGLEANGSDDAKDVRSTDLPVTSETMTNEADGYNPQKIANRREDLENQTRYEMAAEASPLPRIDARSDERFNTRSPVTGPNETRDAAGGLGMVGLGLSLLSLFLLPYLLAPVGIVLGYLAARRNAGTLGTWAMIVGAVAILGALIIYPYFIAR
ncbi:DUF456 domain-containing protein [Brevibacillus sp. SYSU BS000544]|uniref:DUF456 domain-containing protein n=1 Tax=Brevibacillus sp. SYSU BS000544 TaxID=3416443 RepID=UPI003CE4D91B